MEENVDVDGVGKSSDLSTSVEEGKRDDDDGDSSISTGCEAVLEGVVIVMVGMVNSGPLAAGSS